jgi:hypothetical protein
METQLFNSGADKSSQLAAALGATQAPLAALAENRTQQIQEDAVSWANSNSTADIASAIKGGGVLPSESPVFVAALNNIYGTRMLADTVAQVGSDLTTGKLKFGSSAELDVYMTKIRNDSLSGQNNFMVKGYDKSFLESKAALSKFVRQSNDQTQINEAALEGAATLNAQAEMIVDPKLFQGTAEEGADLLYKTYRLLVDNGAVSKEAAETAMKDTLGSLSKGGHVNQVKAILAIKTSEGIKMRDILGATPSAVFVQNSEIAYEKSRVDSWEQNSQPFALMAREGNLVGSALKSYNAIYEAHKTSISTSNHIAILNSQDSAMRAMEKQLADGAFNAEYGRAVANNNAQVRALVTSGTADTLRQTVVLTLPDNKGGKKPVSKTETEDLIYGALDAETKEYSPEARLNMFVQNNTKDREMVALFNKTSALLGMVTVGSNGQTLGAVPDELGDMLNHFGKLNKLNPMYMSETIGNSKQYEQLEMASWNLNAGRSLAEVALGMAKMDAIDADSATIAGMTTAVRDGVTTLTTPGLFRRALSTLPFTNEADISNLSKFQTNIRKWAMFSVVTGGANVNEAVAAATQHWIDNSERVGNTMMLKTDLPKIPPAVLEQGTTASWTERYMEEKVHPIAKAMGHSVDKIRLEKIEGGYAVYLAGDSFMMTPEYKPLRIPNSAIGAWSVETLDRDYRNNKFDAHITREEQRIGGSRGAIYGSRINNSIGTIVDQNRDLVLDQKWDKLSLEEILSNIKNYKSEN